MSFGVDWHCGKCGWAQLDVRLACRNCHAPRTAQDTPGSAQPDAPPAPAVEVAAIIPDTGTAINQICRKCGMPCVYSLTWFDGRPYHPECFDLALSDENPSYLRSDIERLRTALIATGRHLGAFLADDVSTDFLMGLPEEARLVVERLTRAAPPPGSITMPKEAVEALMAYVTALTIGKPAP